MAARQPAGKSLDGHLSTIIASLITAAVVFVGSQMYNTNRGSGELLVKIEFMSKQLDDMKREIATLNGNNVTKQEFRDLEQRVRDLETRKK